MSLETISSVDINFSNGGGEHTANITSFLDVKNTDGTPSLGIVNGEIGSKNYFSQDEINKIMERFICTSISKSKSPVGTTVSRKYSDKTSMTLKSYVVLVRGLNAPPDDTDEYEGMFPFFSEVKGSPLNPFPSVGIREIKDKRVIVAGKIYNYESTTVLSGLKVALVYQNGQLVNDLCINADTVTEAYKNLPNLSSYGLKFGYTLNEYIDILNYVGITHKGLEDIPNKDKILFQVSGSLADITSAIASFFGFYYFIDPNTGFLNFIDSNIAANISITDYTQTTNENIVSATFSEEKFAPEIVNTYVGSTDKQGAGSQDSRFSMGDGKPRKLGMYRVDTEKWRLSFYSNDSDKAGREAINLSTKIFQSYFSFFAAGKMQGADEIFDKLTYLLLLFKEGYSGVVINGIDGSVFDFKNLYRDVLKSYVLAPFSRDTTPDLSISKTKDQAFGVVNQPAKSFYFDQKCLDAQRGNKVNKGFAKAVFDDIPVGFSHTRGRTQAFYHYLQTNQGNQDGNNGNMTRPKNTELFDFLENYFEFGGGIYISQGMGESKKEAVDSNITNARGLNYRGTFHIDDALSKHGTTSDIANWILRFTGVQATVRDLVNASLGPQQGADVGEFYTIATLPFMGMIPDAALGRFDNSEFIKLHENTEFRHEGEPNFAIGHAAKFQENGKTIFHFITEKIITPSAELYNLARKNRDDQIQMDFKSSQLTAKEKNEKAEEDKQLVGQPADTEKLQELLQRYDLKSYVIDAPKTEDFTPLTVQSSSGSVVEMTALRNVSLKEYESVNIKPLKSSSKTIYGLEVPSEFKVTTNSFSIKVASDGITTTIGESTLKLLPPDRQFMISLEMEAFGTPSINPRLKAAQRNFLGL